MIRAPLLAALLVVSCASPQTRPSDSPPATSDTGAASASASAPAPPACAKELVVELAGTAVWRLPKSTVVAFKAGMTIDAAGAPRAYHKDDAKGLDVLTNAGREGNWTALVTDTGKPDGKPVVQGRADPAPGYYVSTTALFDKNKPARSPARYVDASQIPYVALPPEAKEWGAKLGDFAVVMNGKSGRLSFAIVADVGPPAKLGAGSIALADAVGIASSPRDGGLPFGVVYAVFTGSGNGGPRSAADIQSEGKRLFDALGGRTALAICFR
jgi:hypothetical protein